MSMYAPWRQEIERAELTLRLIRRCVAPSPRKAAWVARTEAALALLKRRYGKET